MKKCLNTIIVEGRNLKFVFYLYYIFILLSSVWISVKPRKPRLEYGGTILNSALTLREGQEVTISCVSRYGNPPALIKWWV